MKLKSPVEEKRARIEIIPLIDIMFFLLACFMLVSLSMIQMRGMVVSLPTAVNALPELNKDFVAITIDKNADIFLEKERIDDKDLMLVRLKKMVADNKDVRIYIRADENVSHGKVINVLDIVRGSGAKKVAFELKAQSVQAPVDTAPGEPPKKGATAPVPPAEPASAGVPAPPK